MRPTLFVPDTHAPYHDERAFRLMVQVATDLQVERIVILGDFADMYSASDHDKDPRRATRLAEELPTVLSCLDALDGIGAEKKYYVAGNHEVRLERFISRTKVLHGLPQTEYRNLLGLQERGWQWTPYRSELHLGSLMVTHDVGFSGKYAHYQAGARAGKSVVQGHTHRMCSTRWGTQSGDSCEAVSFGWLGDKSKADYMYGATMNAEWQLGFGLGYESEGQWWIVQVPIIDHACVAHGQRYELSADVDNCQHSEKSPDADIAHHDTERQIPLADVLYEGHSVGAQGPNYACFFCAKEGAPVVISETEIVYLCRPCGRGRLIHEELGKRPARWRTMKRERGLE